MQVTSVSRRYASALFDFAEEQHAKSEVRADCAAMAALFDESPDFSDFVLNPTIPPADAEQMLVNLFDAKAHPVTLQFLRFLVSRNRLAELRAVCEIFEEMTCDEQEIIKVNITAAHELTEQQLNALLVKLREQYQKEIEAEVDVDRSLIGGFKIKVGDHIRDFSLLSKLDQFEQSVIRA
ncbi:ATP synthase F1 subunit delta [Pontiella agarivorans]|uniref:ATP synthase subunit delta n=1 Tax=Pontiella agarivorans TaxID=3038953 RepID=A0ABU5MX42_9BACT|nr:ATP synthase F1 subunit delta [Pontiella agarivorans]MDZ8118636.1 ATP synthase F1 subunit delta [Pontiella agarivorans]